MSASIALTSSLPASHNHRSEHHMSFVHSSPSGQTNTEADSQASTPQSSNQSSSRTGSKNSRSMAKQTSSKFSPKQSRNEVKTPTVVKKEPLSSPDARHRPQKLDLKSDSCNSNYSNDATNSFPPATSRPIPGPLTARMDGLGIQEAGLACLSPGFKTQDPTMQDHVKRSWNVRSQQRTLIESRMNKQTATSENTGGGVQSARGRDGGAGTVTNRAPLTSKRKPPPQGLSIVTPSHEEFAQERVIQSAPLNQSFTLGRYQPQPLTRHIANQPSNLSNTSHIHVNNTNSSHQPPHPSHLPHSYSPGRAPSNNNTPNHTHQVPSIHLNNRLPPITDIIGSGAPPPIRESVNQGSSAMYTSVTTPNNSQASNPRPSRFGSPVAPGVAHPLHSGRPREYRSAEEAQAELSGGRPELLPKLIHYGGHQLPTSPSPQANKIMRQSETSRSGSGSVRRRTRLEYEEGESPPLGTGPNTSRKTGPFGEGRDSPMTSQVKKEQFIRLCAEAWDLFHS